MLKLHVTHLCVLEGQWCGVELITPSTYDFPFTYLRLMSGCEETRDSFGVYWQQDGFSSLPEALWNIKGGLSS